MKVHGEEITELQIEAGLKAMTGKFTLTNIAGALHRAGVTNCERTADRLLSREKVAGRIVYSGGFWTQKEQQK